MDPLSTTASIIAIIQALGACWKFYSSAKDAKKDILGLQGELASIENLLKQVEGLIRGSNGHKLSNLTELDSALKGCEIELERLKKKLHSPERGKLLGLVRQRAKWPFTGPEVTKIVENLERWKGSINLALNIEEVIQIHEVHQTLDLAKLPIAEGAAYGSFEDQHEPVCLPGTRTDLRKSITNWVDDPDGKCIFWLSGVAGTGKSTISRTTAGELAIKNQLAASFIFRRGEKDRGDAAKFFTTLAFQMSNFFRDMRKEIHDAMDAEPALLTSSLSEQFIKLILRPLSGITRPNLPNVVIVIDALDECDREDDQKLIVILLGRLKEIPSVNIRVLLTSRPELPLRLGFGELSKGTYQDVILHEVPGVDKDIQLFFENELSKIRKGHSISTDWPGAENVQKLVSMAVPLFIFAATACRFIGDRNWDPQDQIELVLKYQSNWHTWHLERTYLPILHQFTNKQSLDMQMRLAKDFKSIVGTIVNLATPLSIPALAELLSISERRLDRRLDPLHSVLDIPPRTKRDSPVRTFHLSFRDFLVDQRLRESKIFGQFWIDEKNVHDTIFKRCLELMTGPNGLRKDICQLKSPGIFRSEVSPKVIDEHIKPALAYACRYWVYHLQEGRCRIKENDEVQVFLETHLLTWFESMSLLNSTNETAGMIETMSQMIDVEKEPRLYSVLRDIRHFALHNGTLIALAPLQVYVSALIFSPEWSCIRQMFKPEELIPWVKCPQLQYESNHLLQTIDEHAGIVNSIAFSPDGEILALGLACGVVRLWNAITRALIKTLEPNSRNISVSALGFSQQGGLAAGYNDGTVVVWNLSTGRILHTFYSRGDAVCGLYFSKKADLLMSSCLNKTTIFWDTIQWSIIQRIDDYAVSPDGRFSARLCSGDIHLKDLKSEVQEFLTKVEGTYVRRLRFSPDGRFLAILDDVGLRMWDTEARTSIFSFPIARLRGFFILGDPQLALETIVEFSPDSQLVAIFSIGNAIEVWSLASKERMQFITGDLESLFAISFSPSNLILATASFKTGVKLWELHKVGPLPNEPVLREDGAGMIKLISIDPTGRFFASISEDRPEIRLWNIDTGSLVMNLVSDERIKASSMENDLVFSSDGKYLAASNVKGQLLVWNIDSLDEAKLTTIQNTDIGKVFALSPEGSTLASYDRDKGLFTISTLMKSRHVQSFGSVPDSGDISALAFSNDGAILFSASLDARTTQFWLSDPKNVWKIRLWDVATQTLLKTIAIDCGADAIFASIYKMAISPNGKVLAGAKQGISYNHSIEVWDLETGCLMTPFSKFHGQTSPIPFQNLSFCKSDKYIQTGHTSIFYKNDCQNLEDLYGIITISDDWVYRGEERILWLPHSYRSRSFDIYDNRIVVLGHNGCVSVIKFDFKSSIKSVVI